MGQNTMSGPASGPQYDKPYYFNAPVMAAAPPDDDELMNLITWNGAKDLYGKAKGTGLFNLDSNPANEPWRNGMTDFSLQNLGLIKTRPHR